MESVKVEEDQTNTHQCNKNNLINLNTNDLTLHRAQWGMRIIYNILTARQTQINDNDNDFYIILTLN